jgi:DNA-3-methyladenine glycosylase II
LSAALRHLKKDRKLAKVIDKIGKYNLPITKNPYESLVEAIITQQLSGKAADSISGRFRGIYGRFPKPVDVLKTPDAKLRKAGLSYMKISYIKDLSSRVESKEIKLSFMKNLTDEEVIAQLTEVRGIGRWTAEMFLIFSLGRQDVLPVGDLGLKKGIQRLYSLEELPEKEQMEKIAEKWRPYRSVATWYLWRSLNQFDIG